MHYYAMMPARAGRAMAVLSAALAVQLTVAVAQTNSGPTATGPYTVSVFAPPPPGLTNPDSITVGIGKIFVTYANNSQPDGSAGSSTVVQYGPRGKMIRRYTIVGKNDGLKFDPRTGKIWVLRNEDANPALTIIDPKTGEKTDYTYAQQPAHGGGYDDVAFVDDKIYISASNPTTNSNGQNIFPSIVRAHLSGHLISVTPILNGDAPLVDIATGKTAVSPQSDPDSLKVDPFGGLVLDSQADGDLIFLYDPGTRHQTSLRLHLTNGTSNQITVDDTVFPTTPRGTIFVVDTGGDTVYAVKSNAFQPGGAYSASDSDGILGKVDLSTGMVTPIVSGMKSPHGALFIPANGNDSDSDRDDDFRDYDP